MLAPVLAQSPFPMQVVRQGSLIWLAFHSGAPPRTAITLEKQASAQFAALFHAMLARGVYLPPSPYEVCFLSLAHTQADLEQFVAALREALPEAAGQLR
jgi:glutamate-1-semialdehyde 2,1-aminomutase